MHWLHQCIFSLDGVADLLYLRYTRDTACQKIYVLNVLWSIGPCTQAADCVCEQGSAGDHMALRSKVVEHMRAHREHFEPFVEDDVGCDLSTSREAHI